MHNQPTRRSRGTRPMQMLAGLFGYAVLVLLGILIATSWADWLTGYDTVRSAFDCLLARLHGASAGFSACINGTIPPAMAR